MDNELVRVEFHNDGASDVRSGGYDDGGDVVTVVEVPEGTYITDAAAKAGVHIPTLCAHPRLHPVGRCGMCVVSVEDGVTTTQLACSTYCKKSEKNKDRTFVDEDGSDYKEADMKIHVNGTDLNAMSAAAYMRNTEHSRRMQQMKHIQKTHRDISLPCAGGSVEIEDLAQLVTASIIDESSNSIMIDPSLCVGCSRCVRACGDQMQGMNVLEIPMPDSHGAELQQQVGIAQPPPIVATRTGRPLQYTDCISCGQCSLFCPTGAIREVDHVSRVVQALEDPSVVVVVQTAPSSRVTVTEMFPGGKPPKAGEECRAVERRLVGAARACGFDYVFDTNVAADLTIVEEAHELLHRIEISQNGSPEEKKRSPLPMFTSCCPGWVNLVEQSYPHLIPHLSTCRSPMGMLSSVLRHHWWPQHLQCSKKTNGDRSAGGAHGIDSADQSKLFIVAVMPCTAKKDELARSQYRMKNGKPETDAVLTVRELGRLMELRGVAQLSDLASFLQVPESNYDNPFGEATGAAALFGTTGGVMEAALRTAADVLSGKDLQEVHYESVRGMAGIKKSTVTLGKNNEVALNVAVCHQMRNVREFISQIQQNNNNLDEGNSYHFVEIMTCPGGCIGGGGLPQSKNPDVLKERANGLYTIDERKVKRKSHENDDVNALYRDLLGNPSSQVSHSLLHTSYFARPRKPLPVRKMVRKHSLDISSRSDADHSNVITILYGSQGGTTKKAATTLKTYLQDQFKRDSLDTKVQVVAGNALSAERMVTKLRSSFMSILLTSTFGDGGFPDMMHDFWDHISSGEVSFESTRYAVFGLGSTMYAGFEEELFNRASKLLDRKLEELGGKRIEPLGLGDEMSSNGYRDGYNAWVKDLYPKLVYEIENVEEDDDTFCDRMYSSKLNSTMHSMNSASSISHDHDDLAGERLPCRTHEQILI